MKFTPWSVRTTSGTLTRDKYHPHLHLTTDICRAPAEVSAVAKKYQLLCYMLYVSRVELLRGIR